MGQFKSRGILWPIRQFIPTQRKLYLDTSPLGYKLAQPWENWNGIHLKRLDICMCSGCDATQKVVNVTLGTSIVPLPCINNWIVMMSRYNGSLDFNRPWQDYKIGFGDLRASEFWIGNENVYLYTNQPGQSCILRIEVR